MGTDLYWDKTLWEEQAEAFTIQIGWAKKYKLPVVIHCRESIDQTIELLTPLARSKAEGSLSLFFWYL
jgi:TatD DNase family protein